MRSISRVADVSINTVSKLPTIAAKFNSYRFADHKEGMITCWPALFGVSRPWQSRRPCGRRSAERLTDNDCHFREGGNPYLRTMKC